MIINKTKVNELFPVKGSQLKLGPFTLTALTEQFAAYHHFSITKENSERTIYLGVGIQNTSKTTLKKWLLEAGFEKNLLDEYIDNDYNYVISIIDFLYNRYKEKWWDSNGRPLDKTVSELTNRIMYSNVNNAYTNTLLTEYVNKGFKIPDGLISYLHTITDLNTKKKVYYVKIKHSFSILAPNMIPIPLGINMEKLGYVRIDSRTYVSAKAKKVTYDGVEYWDWELSACKECNSLVPKHKILVGRCPACLKIDPDLLVIRPYSDRAPNFLKLKEGKYNKSLFTKPLFFGIELEYETTDRNEALYKTIKVLSEHVICKRDASIGEEGIEIVTTPATFNEQIKAFKPFFEDFPKEFLSTSKCGMHIHVAKEPLSMLTQGKIVEFMNREENATFITLIAGRDFNNYSRQDSGRKISFPFTAKETNRYNTVNIANRHTLEFRIFSTPTTWDNFMYKLDFVNALVAYSAPCQTEAKTLKEATHYTNFVFYIKDRAKTYPYFYEFLVNNKILTNKINTLPSKYKFNKISHIELSKETLI